MTGSSCAGRSAATSSGTRITAARSCSLRAARASFRFVRFCVIGSSGSDVPARLLYSSRTHEDVIYRGELDASPTGSRSCTRSRASSLRLGRIRAASRLRASPRWRAGGGERARLRPWADQLRRDGRGRAAGSATRRPESRPSGSEPRDADGSTGRKRDRRSAVRGLRGRADRGDGHLRPLRRRRPRRGAVVYLEAPGTVVRCRICGSVVMVIVEVRGTKCVDLRGLAVLERERS